MKRHPDSKRFPRIRVSPSGSRARKSNAEKRSSKSQSPRREDVTRRASPARKKIHTLWRAAYAIVLLTLIAACVVTSVALFTSVCQITQVNITGNKNVTADYARQLSGVEGYSNLVTLPVGRIARNLKGNPWIKEVKVKRRLLHTVDIRVIERTPVCVLEQIGTRFALAGDGFVIAKLEPGQFKEFPSVHGGDAPLPLVGEKLANRKILECVSVLNSMQETVRDTILLGNPFDGRGPVFVSRSGFNIVYGQARECARKNEVLEAIIVDVENNKRKIAYIDVRVPDSPAIKLR